MIRNTFDIVIIGGGLVGASLAVALAPTEKRICLVEPHAIGSADQPSYDERTVALTHSAKLIFGAMGIWQKIHEIGAEAILDIHISNQGHFGKTHLTHKDAGTDALGYVVATRVLGKVLWNEMSKNSNLSIACPAQAIKLNSSESINSIEIEEQGGVREIEAKLVVIADGGRSMLATDLGLQYQTEDYFEAAVLSIISTDTPHNGRAYERFTPHGPLALLPLGFDGAYRFASVWTTNENTLEHRMQLTDTAYITDLQNTFGDRAGLFSNPSARKSYTLKRSILQDHNHPRTIVIGNAAHTVHPVAGQGFNLGLRDVANLAEIIFHAQNADIGSESLINQYNQSRCKETRLVSSFTHGLLKLFKNESKTLSLLRNFGLQSVEHFPPAKRMLLRRTMGLSGVQSRFALGQPLTK